MNFSYSWCNYASMDAPEKSAACIVIANSIRLSLQIKITSPDRNPNGCSKHWAKRMAFDINSYSLTSLPLNPLNWTTKIWNERRFYFGQRSEMLPKRKNVFSTIKRVQRRFAQQFDMQTNFLVRTAPYKLFFGGPPYKLFPITNTHNFQNN